MRSSLSLWYDFLFQRFTAQQNGTIFSTSDQLLCQAAVECCRFSPALLVDQCNMLSTDWSAQLAESALQIYDISVINDLQEDLLVLIFGFSTLEVAEKELLYANFSKSNLVFFLFDRAVFKPRNQRLSQISSWQSAASYNLRLDFTYNLDTYATRFFPAAL